MTRQLTPKENLVNKLNLEDNMTIIRRELLQLKWDNQTKEPILTQLPQAKLDQSHHQTINLITIHPAIITGAIPQSLMDWH